MYMYIVQVNLNVHVCGFTHCMVHGSVAMVE